jgi:predicted ATPase
VEFLAQVVGAEDLRVGRGQCIEHHGAGEAYLPLLEALGGLARRTEGRSLIPILMHTVGFYLSGPQHLVLPAEAYGRAGQANEGFGVLEEGLATAQRTGERWYEAELYRLKGELMLQQSGSGVPNPEREAEAEGCFLQAIEIVRNQGARLFQLRAAISLTRLRLRQGKKEGAYPQLAEVYGWFTEGFETKDLQEARELLETSG